MGNPIRKQHTRETIKNASPPLEAASVGNLQILPKPIAEPAAAIINPSLEFQLPRLLVGDVAKVVCIYIIGVIEIFLRILVTQLPRSEERRVGKEWRAHERTES